MFLNYIKDFSVKKRLKNSLQNVKTVLTVNSIKTIGLLIDESYFSEINLFRNELILSGILESNIEVLVYRDRLKKNKSVSQATFSANDLNWNGTISNRAVNEFVNKQFDLLISYYDVEKAVLLVVTHNSKAHFKVGFAAINKKFNDLMINTNAENYKVFTHELFRYLKILKKI
ncbi:DUF6913 domain-containing protein [Flavobacterium sp. W22_SRS_FP1]|uniref:DUF6913 domain-containing protein n=1 Tax=Flavobacterium sp. W22_SRS_FP1 TaxID=3240276 RepID=UPI003F91387D